VVLCYRNHHNGIKNDLVIRSWSRDAVLEIHKFSRAKDSSACKSTFSPSSTGSNTSKIVAVFVVTILAALLTLIYIGSPVAFNDVISLTVTGFYGSYFLPSAFLLYHRLKGHVFTADAAQLSTETNFPPVPSSSEEKTEKSDAPDLPTTDLGEGIAQAQLIWGPFRIPGILGIINNLYACMYMLFVIFWSVWPPGTPVSAATMNYSVLVTGGVIIFSVVWYWVRGRKEYNGPTVDEEVKAALRGSIVALWMKRSGGNGWLRTRWECGVGYVSE
jgi:choline transport protein